MLSVCLLNSVCQIKRWKTEVKLEIAPNPHHSFPALKVYTALLQTSEFHTLAAGSQVCHTSLQPWLGNQQSCQPSSKLTAEIWKPLPKTNICILHLTSISAKCQSRSFYIRFTSSQNVQKACSQIKLQFTELDVVDGTGFQTQSPVTGSDLQV